jgi:hypothetical protein
MLDRQQEERKGMVLSAMQEELDRLKSVVVLKSTNNISDCESFSTLQDSKQTNPRNASIFIRSTLTTLS